MDQILERINEAGISLLDTTTPENTYKSVVNEALKLLKAEYGSIYLVTDGKLKNVLHSKPFLHKIKIKKGLILEKVFDKNKNKLEIIDQALITDQKLKNEGINSIVLMPMSYRNEVIGILVLYSLNKEHFTKQQINKLKVFSSMASFAVKKSQLYIETRKAVEIRDMFISMAAHELRTPLTTISGYIQLLHHKFIDSDNPAKKWVDALYEENKRMMHLVTELLEVNRLKAGQIQFRWQECDLESIIKESIKLIKLRFNERDIRFQVVLNNDSIIIGDSERLQQAFINLIDNALKYSESRYPVEVTLTDNNSGFKVLIKDFGKGIDKKDLPHIFAGHHKGEGGEEGFGLGLFFVENIIRQHRGTLKVKSKLKKGTVMEVKLPKSKFNKL